MAGLPNDDWLTTERVIHLLQQLPPDIHHQTALTGRKDNSYHVVDNINNTECHRRGQRQQYDDDCGAWNKWWLALQFPLHCVQC